MKIIEVIAPASMYSKEVVQRAAHRHSDDYFIEIVQGGEAFQIRLTPKDGTLDTCRISLQLNNDLLDEALRESVRQQTSAIQEILLRAALAGASGGER
jgi:His-Xaa-Ser system protein HxsD